MELNFQVKPRAQNAIIASYSCPCGCSPRVTYVKGTPEAVDGCCCGNKFAVGPGAGSHHHAADGFDLQVDRFLAPWGESLEAAWLLSAAQAGNDRALTHADHHHGDEAVLPGTSGTAIDPVCSMTVEVDAARVKGLGLVHDDTDYYFCGKDCKLEFVDDPAKYLDPGHVPSM